MIGNRGLADVTMAQDALSRLEDRDRLVEQFQTAKEERIVSSLQQTKARFEKLGMLQEAEEARLLVDSLLKEERAKSQLEAAMSAGEVSLESLRNRFDIRHEFHALIHLCAPQNLSQFPSLRLTLCLVFMKGIRCGLMVDA